jgi:hypothetical protein
MASHRVSAVASVDVLIDGYLAELASRLRGPRRRRQAILAELRDGLHQAADDHTARASPPAQAATAAIAQFGAPQAVADAFAGELATAYARRTIGWYIITGPLVGVWWLLLLHPHPWNGGLLALLTAIPVVPLVVIALATAGGTFATTGRLMRWLPEASPRRALTGLATIAALCLAGDLTMIVIFPFSDSALQGVAVAAVAASLARIACSITAIGRVFRMRPG